MTVTSKNHCETSPHTLLPYFRAISTHTTIARTPLDRLYKRGLAIDSSTHVHFLLTVLYETKVIPDVLSDKGFSISQSASWYLSPLPSTKQRKFGSQRASPREKRCISALRQYFHSFFFLFDSIFNYAQIESLNEVKFHLVVSQPTGGLKIS